jgi:hypothetical protein
LANLAVHPQFAFLRGQPGFESILARMNVPANLRHSAPVSSAGDGGSVKNHGKS